MLIPPNHGDYADRPLAWGILAILISAMLAGLWLGSAAMGMVSR